jgi:hypothetical protein
MKLVLKVFTVKGALVLLPIVGLFVAAQNCDQGLAAAAFALSILGVITPVGMAG